MDIAKAFDKVWHDGLIFKIQNSTMPKYLTKLTKDYLENRTFSVKINNTRSSIRKIESGVPQGSALGPILFNLYMSNLKPTEGVCIALFADDLAVMYKHKRAVHVHKHLNNAMEDISNWYTKWRLPVNSDKSQSVYFTKSVALSKPFEKVHYKENAIEWTNQAKYLGVTLDFRLTFTPHIRDKIKSTNIIKYQLYPLIGRRSKLPIKTKLGLYKAIIIPHLTYACPTWGHAKPTAIKKIQIVQNKILREICNAPWFLRNKNIHQDLNIKSIEELIKKTAIKFFENLQLNEDLEKLCPYDKNT